MATPLRDWAVGEHNGRLCRSVYRAWALPRSLPLVGTDCAELDTEPVDLAELVADAASTSSAGSASVGSRAVRRTAGAARRAAVRRAEHELADASGPIAERAALARLVDRLARHAEFDPVVLAAVDLLAAPDARVDGVGERVGVSPRALRRRLRAAVGMGPKQLHRVLRFRRFSARLGQVADGRRSLAELAAELGYADQAHLGRECPRLSGSAPAALARRWRPPGEVAETFQTAEAVEAQDRGHDDVARDHPRRCP